MDSNKNLEHNIYQDIHNILEQARKNVYSAINFAMVEAFWEIGKHISKAQDNNPRAEYGTQLLKYLSKN